MSRGKGKARKSDDFASRHTHDPDEDIINEDKLQILFNIMKEPIKIQYPLYNFEFARVHKTNDGYKLKVTCNEDDFDSALNKFGGHARELPTYSDLRGGMLSSGVLKLSNLDHFNKKVQGLQSLNKDFKFSLDTNLLYLRFISNYELIKPSEIVLVETTGKEIIAKLNYKYSSKTLNALKRTIYNSSLFFDELWNRRVKRSRKAAYIALKEYKMLMDSVADELEEVTQSIANSRANDLIIVRTLAEFESEGHSLPVFLTADDAMADLCKAEGLEYYKFDIPHLIEATHCTIKQLSNLVFNLAVVLGFVQVNSVVIFGEFRGKSSNNPDDLKVKYLDNRLKRQFKKDLRICRRLIELGIEK